MMESILTYAIPEKPDLALTHALTKHIVRSQAHLLPLASEALVAAALRIMLGDEYADDIGLPQAGLRHRVLGRLRLLLLRLLLLLYRVPVVDRALAWLMGRLFRLFVRHVHDSQPACRFGVLAVR